MANNRNTFVNVEFKNHLELLDHIDEMVETTPDLDKSRYIRRLVRRDMLAIRRRRQSQAELDRPQRKVMA